MARKRASSIAALAGGTALAVFAASRWLGGEGGAPGDVGMVAVQDVLVARDAQSHAGRLEGCNASSCELDGRHYERRALAFIGLSVEAPTPPPVEDPAHDELHLHGGGVVHEPLARIDAEAVFAGARRFERGEVDWVYLAAEREPQPPQAGAPEPEPQGSDQPAPPPPQPEPADSGERPRPEPRPPRSEDAGFQGCPDSNPLGAWIWFRTDFPDVLAPSCMGSETHVVRFRLQPETGAIAPGAKVALAYGARELRYTASSEGCFDAPQSDPYSTCNAEGAYVEETLALTPENLGFAKFFPLEPSLSFQYPTPPGCPDVPPGHEDLRTEAQREAAAAAERAIPGAPGTSDVLEGVPLAAPAPGSGPSGAAAPAGAGSAEAQQVGAANQRLDGPVQRMAARTAEQIAPRLAPLLLRAPDELEPEFVVVLLEKAAGELQQLVPDLEQAASAAEEIQRTVEGMRPAEAATPGSR